MNVMGKNLLMIFTRNPELGKVKTRLAKTTGNEAALEIYKLLLHHTFTITKKLNCHKMVYYSDSINQNDIWTQSTYQKREQKGENLGERMLNAFSENLSNYDKIIIIGSDIHELKPEHIEQAFKKLDTHDIVIGPAKDGGYYLLGLKLLNSNIFRNKNWGTSTVLEKTLEDLKNENVHLLEVLNDIDTYEDLIGNDVFRPFIKNNQ